MINEAKKLAIKAHSDVNHTYGDGLPYSFHLETAFKVGDSYKELLNSAQNYLPWHTSAVLSAVWLHDTLEDTRLSYNDLIKKLSNLFGVPPTHAKFVAEIVYAVTNEKGRNRKERANDKYYQGIRENPYAVFVKLCDRIANIKFSIFTENKRMFRLYKQENEDFVNKIYSSDVEFLKPMFDELESLVNSG